MDDLIRKEDVLIDVNLTIKEKSLTALKGPSGSGKSTLLNLICGLDKVSSGNIIFNELDITKMSTDQLCAFRNKNIGIVFQFFNLIKDLTVLDILNAPPQPVSTSTKSGREDALVILSTSINTSCKVVIPKSGTPKLDAATPPPDK